MPCCSILGFGFSNDYDRSPALLSLHPIEERQTKTNKKHEENIKSLYDKN